MSNLVGYISIRQACELLGIRHRGKGIPPRMETLIREEKFRTTKQMIGKTPTHMVSVEDVEAYREKNRRGPSKPRPASEGWEGAPGFVHTPVTEDQVSTMFRYLGQGKSLEEAIVDLKIFPWNARVIYREWCAVRGQIVLSTDTLRWMERLGLEGTFPLENEAQVRAVIEDAAKDRFCQVCERRAASLCRACVSKKPRVKEASEGEPSA